MKARPTNGPQIESGSPVASGRSSSVFLSFVFDTFLTAFVDSKGPLSFVWLNFRESFFVLAFAAIRLPVDLVGASM
jgi:hypothetical protein